MQSSRLAGWMVFTGILLVLASIGLLSSVADDWEQANGPLLQQKITVNAGRSEAAGSTPGLHWKDAERLAQRWSPLPTAYSARTQTAALFGSNAAHTDVFGVSGSFRDFTAIPMVSGSSITQRPVDEHSRVAVIGARVADSLFHSTSVAGKTIELFGVAFTVIGVFDDEGSLLRMMSDDGVPDVLIPITTMFDVYPGARIETIQLAVKSDAAFGVENKASEALRAIGSNPAQFHFVNDTLTFARFAQLRFLLLTVCMWITVVLLARFIVRHTRVIYDLLRSRLITDNWTDALRNERSRITRHLLAVIVMAGGAVGVWKLTIFRFDVPPEWIPEQIIDISFYMDKLRSLWQEQASQIGYLPPPHELIADAAGQLTVKLFIAGAMIGLPLFLLGLRLWALERIALSIQLQRLCIYVVLSAVASFGTARLAGMAYRIEPLEYMVTSALFLVSILHFNKGVTPSHGKNVS
ncbi:ABC transporter permease [Paenibacillus silviterrae]|uniref:ABC transporter permease n=1 Tax=Paenibacillus silviterrae TaxID=3242194 RepID=UPI0025433456|nr:ABC transporter permease [Paenibacillus chinjuensis]